MLVEIKRAIEIFIMLRQDYNYNCAKKQDLWDITGRHTKQV